MANQPHPDRQAVTYRLHRDLVRRLKTEAAARGMTEVDLVTLAIEHELASSGIPEVRGYPADQVLALQRKPRGRTPETLRSPVVDLNTGDSL